MKDFPDFLESVILSFRNRLFFRRNPIDASDGALIMTIGILLISIHSRFQHMFIFTLDLALLIFWLYLFATFLKTALKGSFRRRYLTHPVQSFAVGTWIACTSILCFYFSNSIIHSTKQLFQLYLFLIVDYGYSTYLSSYYQQ